MDKNNSSPQMTAASSTAFDCRPSVAAMHTRGSWRSRKIRYGGYTIESELPCMNGLRAWFTVAIVHAHDDAERLMSEGAVADAEDDARLIAAAPTLLEALKAMVEGVMHADAETLHATPWMAQMTQTKLNAARAAIAKAEAK